jgi:hypothetical protein
MASQGGVLAVLLQVLHTNRSSAVKQAKAAGRQKPPAVSRAAEHLLHDLTLQRKQREAADAAARAAEEAASDTAAPPAAIQHHPQQLQPSKDGSTPEDDADDFVLLSLSCYSTLEAELRQYKRNILGPGSCIRQEAVRVFKWVVL